MPKILSRHAKELIEIAIGPAKCTWAGGDKIASLSDVPLVRIE